MSPKVATPRKAPRRRKPSVVSADDQSTYEVILRTTDGATLKALVQDRVLYPMAVSWNRILAADRGRQSNAEEEQRSWQETGRESILKLAAAGDISAADTEAFITAAARSGRVQVEMEWRSEEIGYAARIFPWEALLALATKRERAQADNRRLVVVRWLKTTGHKAPSTGPAGFAVSAAAEKAGYDTATERAAIEHALRGKRELRTLPAKTLGQLSAAIESAKPPFSIIHYVLLSASDAPRTDGTSAPEGSLEKIASTVAQSSPELAVFSTCYSGRRLAPLAVAHGAHLAIGFHGITMDASPPAFFGAFYEAWLQKELSPLDALVSALEVNRTQPNPDDLGVVSLWSATDLLAPQIPRKRKPAAPASEPTVNPLLFTCDLEDALNYSMLHNSRRLRLIYSATGADSASSRVSEGGGIFKRFYVTKLVAGKMDDLEVSIRFDSGAERPMECHFFVPLREAANSVEQLAPHVMLPLGSELLRRRGETFHTTVEIVIRCGQNQIFHKFDSIQLPPCDEWKDDAAGRRFLPSFVFPRDPAVREILTAAQPFLRSLVDDPVAGFDGYQSGFVDDWLESVRQQLRAIWTTLQTTLRLDYVNPPPSYLRGVQRIRTPEEILRARRGTCIELSLLLAACWEHIGIYPVLLLIPGHAFTGYWTSEAAWQAFFDNLVKNAESLVPSEEGVVDAEDIRGADKSEAAKKAGGGTLSKDQAWVLKGVHHLALIRREVEAKNLIPVEATAVALQKSFRTAEREATELLRNVRRIEDFDGMIDGQKARMEGVTPLAILTQNTVA
jgi:hypothetical protein